ncbi:MAG TPA: alpha/beta hydrolase domain-containing protein [Acidimicrobiia bacterium]|nr:alpha/beta hydrolase domain-containing protein [Acidimicrobiia bacterium]
MGSTVTGPITGGTHGWPFGAATIDLAAQGYVEEEYFLAGDATRYRPVGELGTDGRWAVEADGSSPFRTRLLVRRPVDPGRFNGTVIVEWNNVSAGSEIFEAGDTHVVFDEGFAYVGVSAQRVGVHGFAADPHGLVAWDPERYGTLEIVDDGIAYGIFSEAGRVVGPKRDTTVDPLGGLAVERLLALGGSQSASKLATYINAVQPIEHVFDGFVAFTWFGSGSGVDSTAVMDPSDPDARNAIMAHPTRIRDDLDVPVFVINSECETLSCAPVRQPDTDRFRYWEVAGSPHGPRLIMQNIGTKNRRDGMPGPADIDPAVLSPVPWTPVMDAVVSHTQQWMTAGTPPPSQPLIELTATEPPAIARDADGNAIGGVRVPEMAAPLARHVAAMEEAGAAGLMGQWFPFEPEAVRAKYPDAAAYLAAYDAAATAAVEAGVLLPHDADDGRARAAAEVAASSAWTA